MAIMSRFRRMRGSVSSTGTVSQTDSNTSEPSSPRDSKSTLWPVRTFPWRSNGKQTTPSKAKAPKPAAPDPREKPFTETNLKHQELLSAFTMSFGKRKTSSGGRSSFGGVSPGASRQASLDQSTSPHVRRTSALPPDGRTVEPVAE